MDAGAPKIRPAGGKEYTVQGRRLSSETKGSGAHHERLW